MDDRPIFARPRGFTPVTLLVAAVDLAAIVLAALLWWLADAERHGENMPWVFGITMALAAVALAVWVLSGGRQRAAFVVSTLLVVAAALMALFG